jgi:lipopolysaccharide export system protein LptA
MEGGMAGIINEIREIKYGVLFAVLSFLFFFFLTPVSFMQCIVSDVYAADEIKTELEAESRPEPKAEIKQVTKKETKKGSGNSSVMGGSDKEPTVITAQSLTADNKAKTALFTGSVVAKKGDSTLYADRMLVYYVESGDGENSNIDKIEADGHVKLVRNDRVITSGKAVYYAGANERAVFTDKPRATENRNVVTGTIMTYYIKDDRSVVENSKIYIVEKGQEGPERKAGDRKSSDRKNK